MEISPNIEWKTLPDIVEVSDWCLTEEVFEKFSLKPTLCERVATLKKNGEDTVPNSDTSPPIPERKVPFPRISNLSIEDQKYFLQTYKQYILGNEIDLGMIDHLQNIVWTLTAEQEEFSMFLQQHSMSLKDEYNFLQPHVKESVQNLLGDQKARLRQRLPKFYTLFQTVGLSAGAVFPNDPILSYVRTLKQPVGQPLISMPDLEENKIFLLRNCDEEEHAVFQAELWQDSTACDFSIEHGAHFALTAGALQTLIDNQQPDYDKEWELLVTVVDYSNGGIKTECLKTIIVDDPLPPKTITPREMNMMYYQREVCQILSERSYEYKGVPSSRHSFKESVQQKNVFLGSVDFNDRLMADENQPNNSETDNRFLNCHLHVAQHSELETNSVDANYGGDERNTNTKKKQHLKNNDSHFSYSIWTFGNYKLLIRALDHGVLYQSNKGGKGSLHPVNVYVKPEYQLMFGHEQITPSEASKWWMNSYINRNSLCICARVDPVSSELLKIDVLSQAAIIKLTSFNPAQPMKMIHNVLARLEKLLKPGRFILSHSPGDMHICIYELVNEKKDGYSYDLHEAYSHNRDVLVNYDKDVPWVSVDPNMFLEWHIAHDRIPMTFPAVSSEELTKAKEAKLSTGNKKKGKKKKKKKFNVKKTKELSADGKAYENNKLFNTKEHKRLRSRDELSHDLPVAAVKARNNDVPADTGISERFQSRTVPVTYHDMEFNF